MSINNDSDHGISFVKNNTEYESIVKQIAPICKDNFRLYAYSHLNKHEKAVYDHLFDGIIHFKTKIDSFPSNTTKDDISKANFYIYCDHPEIFWFEGKFYTNFQTDTGIAEYIDYVYSMSPDEAKKCQREIEESVSGFLKGITDDMNEYDIALSVFRNIISLVDYDTLKLETSQKLPFFYTHHLRDIYGVFVEKKAICAGYSKAFQYLINRLGIECTFVSGKGKTTLHSWNLIRLDGDYYYIDVTWDDHSDTKPSFFNSREITYDYFCVDSNTLLRDHQLDGEVPMPECTAKECNYFYRNGLLLSSFDYLSIQSIIKHHLSNGCYDITLKASDKNVFDAVQQRLIQCNDLRMMLKHLHNEEGFNLDPDHFRCDPVSQRLRLTIRLQKS